jgi:hypothetical protein
LESPIRVTHRPRAQGFAFRRNHYADLLLVTYLEDLSNVCRFAEDPYRIPLVIRYDVTVFVFNGYIGLGAGTGDEKHATLEVRVVPTRMQVAHVETVSESAVTLRSSLVVPRISTVEQ